MLAFTGGSGQPSKIMSRDVPGAYCSGYAIAGNKMQKTRTRAMIDLIRFDMSMWLPRIAGQFHSTLMNPTEAGNHRRG